MYRLIIYGLFLKSMSVATTEGSTVASEKQATDGVYVGCYPIGCMEIDYHPTLSKLPTPDSCTASCKETGFRIAGLYNRTKCSCSCKQTCLTDYKLTESPRLSYCGLPCRGAMDKMCGGFGTSSLYAVNLDGRLNINCVGVENVTTMTMVIGGNKKPNNPRSSVHIAIPIAVSVTVFLLIIIVAVMLIYRRCRYTQEHEEEAVTVAMKAAQDRKRITKQLSLHKRDVQKRNSRIANATHHQALNSNPQLPDLPQDDVTAAVSPGAEVKEVIYEDPDRRSSHPIAGAELVHEYLVSGQGIPSKSIPSDHADEYHEYNYLDAAEITLKVYDRASKVDEDGYLVAEPQFQSWQNPAGNVYYSSRIHTSQIRGQDESF